jgi:hypothetical protein
LYTTVLATTQFEQRDGKSVATMLLPARVPIERASFTLAAGTSRNFSRPVRLTATPVNEPHAAPETVLGEMTRVDLPASADGVRPEIKREVLQIPATLGANLKSDARVEIAVENGDDAPLHLASVRLEMRERKVCFDLPEEPAKLYYGDHALKPPVYDYARVFDPAAVTRKATLAAEQMNPEFVARPEERAPFTTRHPEVLWVALLGTVGVLAVVAFRSSKKV